MSILQFINSEKIDQTKLLCSLFENSDDNIFILKICDTCLYEYSYANQSYLNLLESEKIITGSRFGTNISLDSITGIIDIFEKVIAENKQVKTLINLNINQKKHFLNTTVLPLHNDKKEVTHLLVIARNDSEKHQIENELKKTRLEAGEAERLKTSLLSNMSHETRTPLNGIIGFAELLRDEAGNDTQREMAKNILFSAKRLMSTLHSILELSRLEASPNPVYNSKVDIITLLNNTTVPFEHEAGKKGLYFVNDYSREAIFTHIDEYLFTQVIGSVLENAVKFTNSGGITIKIYTENLSGIFYACIDIIDTGIGIAPKDQETIFEKFRQASDGYSRTYEGVGLGLTLAKLMTELMNGMISLQSKENSGTKIHLCFPAIKDHVEKRLPGSKAAASLNIISKFKRLLIVEDNSYNQKLLSLYLKKSYNYDFAESGEQALSLLSGKKYDGVLMDINLGAGLNGVDVLGYIRKDKKHKDLPIIAITGYALPADESNIISNGFNAYLSKPYKKEDIFNLLKIHIPQEAEISIQS